MPVKIALPKGRLLSETAVLLERAGWQLSGYHEGMRFYHLKSRRFPDLFGKLFHEKDIPIQVAIGNYDLGICGSDWIEELLARYPSSALVKVRNLIYGGGVLCIAASKSRPLSTLEGIQAKPDTIRIASEYPNLAESLALRLRFRRFSVFPVWGAAEVYPPETADLALIPIKAGGKLNTDLTPLHNILNFSAYLIANKNSWLTKDMGKILASLQAIPPIPGTGPLPGLKETERTSSPTPLARTEDAVRLALPDGHQQMPTSQLLSKAGILVEDYPSATGNRRPTTNLPGITIKVIRPQDMPLQVANGNFDLAITGRDWLTEHLYQFPSSPVTELLDLKSGKVKIVAVVGKDVPVQNIKGLKQFNGKQPNPIRVASEYVSIADKYARDNHLGMYKVVPTWGASEAFLPEDADLLIENTQTGQTIARHNLKIIDTLFESTACLIGKTNGPSSSNKRERVSYIVETLQKAVEAILV